MTINDLDLQDIYNFMENGSVDNAPPEIVAYLSLLDKVRGMLLRIDRYANDEMVIKDLMVTERLSRYRAKKIIGEAREYFYCDNVVSKSAWRNIYAEMMHKVISFSMLTMKDLGDAEKVTKMIERVAKIRQLDLVDVPDIPDEAFQKQLVVYTTDAAALGMTTVDRNRLKELIDDKFPTMTEKERERIYQEADITPFKAFPNDQENPRKV